MIKYKNISKSREPRGKIEIYLVKTDNSESLILSRNFKLHNFSLPTGIGIAEISSARSFRFIHNTHKINTSLNAARFESKAQPRYHFNLLSLLRFDGKGSSRTVGDWTSLAQRQSRSSSLLAETILSATIFAHFLAWFRPLSSGIEWHLEHAISS